MSSAVADCFLPKPDIVSETDRLVCEVGRALLLAAPMSRNGFREVGLGGGSSNGETRGPEVVGEARSRLRKGLFELSDKPADR